MEMWRFEPRKYAQHELGPLVRARQNHVGSILATAMFKSCNNVSCLGPVGDVIHTPHVCVGSCATHSLRSFVKLILNPLLKNAHTAAWSKGPHGPTPTFGQKRSACTQGFSFRKLK